MIFGLTLMGVAILTRRTLGVAVSGLVAVTLYKLALAGFPAGPGFSGLFDHMAAEWVGLANLLLLLLGFALLAHQFEMSKLPDAMPALLPDGWTGGAALLAMVFVMSIFLDNIAAALVGGVIARHVYRNSVTIGFIAAIVAASNAGGAGSVIGDTTTTIMWINGVPPADIARAFVASVVVLAIVAPIASWQQHCHAPIVKHPSPGLQIEWRRVYAAAIILAAPVAANILTNARFPDLSKHVPVIGLAIWAAIIATLALSRPSFAVLKPAFKGAAFLLCLVLSASLMPVETLPRASWPTTLGLGFLSAVFDNIPLTALALRQGEYDWGFLAYAVGVGGSMLWFGSSAGVALTGIYPEGRSAVNWLRFGWYVPAAYVAGFFVMLALLGWHP